MKAAAIYARVSTADQVKGTSLDTQVDECKAFAHQHGYNVIKEIREDMSGATLRRPGLDTVRDMAANHEIEALIVAEQDRLSRSLAHTGVLMEEFEMVRVKLLFVREPKEDTPEGMMLFQMKGMFKEYERAKIAERSRRGKHRRAEEGKVLVSWATPYGYNYTPGSGRFEVDDIEGYWIRKMFEWFTSDRLSLFQLCQRLNTVGAPTKRGAKQGWEPGTVRAMLTNAAYIGDWAYTKTEGVVPKHRHTQRAGSTALRANGYT